MGLRNAELSRTDRLTYVAVIGILILVDVDIFQTSNGTERM